LRFWERNSWWIDSALDVILDTKTEPSRQGRVPSLMVIGFMGASAIRAIILFLLKYAIQPLAVQIFTTCLIKNLSY
jgi:hypothetical protein